MSAQRSIYAPGLVTKMVEASRCARLLAVMCGLCIASAIFDGNWPAAIVALIDARAIVMEARRYDALADRAAEIWAARHYLARAAGKIAEANA